MTERIEINPSVMQGKPVVRGTRIPIELLLRKLAAGATIEDLLDAYPRLTADDIRASLAYAADTIAQRNRLGAQLRWVRVGVGDQPIVVSVRHVQSQPGLVLAMGKLLKEEGNRVPGLPFLSFSIPGWVKAPTGG